MNKMFTVWTRYPANLTWLFVNFIPEKKDKQPQTIYLPISDLSEVCHSAQQKALVPADINYPDA